MANTVKKNIGTVLEQAELITHEQWENILTVHEETNQEISLILENQGVITPQELAIISGLQHNVPFLNLRQQKIEPEALRLIPGAMAREFNAIPIAIIEDALVVVMENPWDIRAIDGLSAQSKMSIKQIQGVPSDIRELIDHSYKASGEIEEQVSHVSRPSLKRATAKTNLASNLTADTPLARAVDMIIGQAVKDQASDIHIEAQEDRLRIRYRIDGILHDTSSLPLDIHAQLVSRLKIMAGMDIADRRRPQDGQFSINFDGKDVDVRLATSDTVNGETIVLRILDKSFALLDLQQLGFGADGLKKYKDMLSTSYGMILSCGPTGSGKTTSLYASVNQLNKGERNIMTIEDPVEYRFNDINQIQVNPQAGITFSTGLKALMRLDPDVILVGEVRDSETANIAVQAALTGHLMLSTIHANDTAGALFRLLDLGIEPFLVSSSLVGVVSQRMVRRVCKHCSKVMVAPEEEQAIYEREMGEKRREFFYGQGCSSCANTGYRGRTGVFEIMLMTEELKHMLISGADSREIKGQAIREGMVPMWRSGMIKVKQGITTPYELLRNVYSIS